MDFIKERDEAVDAALKAASFIRYKAGNLRTGDVREKGLHDLVTVVDEGAEKIIVETLSGSFPGDGFLAEEGTTGVEATDKLARRWIIDPIDGTTNFAHNHSPYCVSIALEVQGRVEVGVVYEIGRDELFTAIRGSGAYVNGRKIRVSQTSDLHSGIVTTGFPFREHTRIDEYMSVLRVFTFEARAVRRPGSAAADLAYVAAGRMDGFFESGLSAWDVAAGALLVQEAGGVVTDFKGGHGYSSGSEILASNGQLHNAMLHIVEPLRGEPVGE